MVMENNSAAPRAKLTGNEDENEEDFLFYKGKGEYGRREEDDDDDEEDDGEYEEEEEGDAEEERKGGEGARAKTNLVENFVLNGSKTVQEEDKGSISIKDEIGGTSSRHYPSLSVSEKSNSLTESSGSYPALSVSEKDFSIEDKDDYIPVPPKNFLVGDSMLLTPEKEKNASTTLDEANVPSLSNAPSFRPPESVKGIDFDDDYDDTSDLNNKSLLEKENILEDENTKKDETTEENEKKEDKSEEEKTKEEKIGEEEPEKNEKIEKEEKNGNPSLTESVSLRVRPVESVEGVRFDDEVIEEEDEDEEDGEGEEEVETTGDKGSKRREYVEQRGEGGVSQDSLESDVTGADFSKSSQTELKEVEDFNQEKNDDLTNLELGIREQSSLYEHGLRVRQLSAEITDVGEFGKILTNEKDVDIAIAKCHDHLCVIQDLPISETKNNSSPGTEIVLEVTTSESSHKEDVSKVTLQEESSIPNSHEMDNVTEVREISVPVPVPAPQPVSVPVPVSETDSVPAPVSNSVSFPAPIPAPVSVSVSVPVLDSVSNEAVAVCPLAKLDSSVPIATEKPVQEKPKSTPIPVGSKGGGNQKLINEDDDENYDVKQKGFRRILGHFVCGCQHRNV